MTAPLFDCLDAVLADCIFDRIVGERPLSPQEPSNAELLDAEAERAAAEESAKDMASDEWAEAHPWAMEWLVQHDIDAAVAILRAAIILDEHPKSRDGQDELVRAIDSAKQAWTEHRVENRRDYR
jgi:hypothetical protein